MPRGVYEHKKGRKCPGSGIYVRTPDMKTGKYKRTDEMKQRRRVIRETRTCICGKIFTCRIASKREFCNIACINKGRKQSQETIDKKRQSNAGYKHTQESRDKIGRGNAGKVRSLNVKQKYSKSRLKRKEELGYLNSPETRGKMSKAGKERWKDPKYRESQLAAIMNGQDTSPNECEKFLIKLLDKLSPNKFEFVGDKKFWLCNYRYNPDFVDKKNKLIIEHYGDLWHANPKHCKLKGITEVRGIPVEVIRRYDKERLKLIKKEGYKVLILWEHELNDTKSLELKIKDFIK